MTYCVFSWRWFLLFFALASILLVSCSESSEPTLDDPVQVTAEQQIATIPPSPPTDMESAAEEIADSEPTPTEVVEHTPIPTDEPEPTATVIETVNPTPEPTSEPIPTTHSVGINGMSAEQFILVSDEVRMNINDVFAQGQALGRDPNVFAILGDSLIATSQSLAKWDGDDYVLGEYEYLQPTIDHYAGSFGRYGVSVRVGLHTWSVFDPLWADKDFCLANEDLLTCEMRLNNPSVMIIFLGSNDAGYPDGFNFNYRKIVEAVIDQGVVPILATKADRFEGPDNINNEIIRQTAADFRVPLLEFDLLADTLPGRGLSSDNVHLTYLEPLDYSSPEMFTLGYPVHNLASLMIIDEVRKELFVDLEN
jgi:hypothetical protein